MTNAGKITGRTRPGGRPLFQRLAAAPHIVWAVLFILAPMLFVLYFAFTDGNGNFTTDNITAMGQYSHTFILSIAFALIATVVCLLIGYPLAYFMSRTSPRTRKVLMVLIMLPMWCNLLIRTYALMALLDNGGLLNSFLESIGMQRLPIVGTDFGVILGMIYDFLPYMVLPIFTVMTKLDNRYIEAAHDLGCSNLQTLFRVVVPMTVSGVVSGVTMVFVPSISTFYISQKLGAGKIDLVGDTIERLFQNTSTYGVGATMSLIMMVLIIVSVCIMNRFTDNEEGGMVI
ncbi:MAG: ABC transporter permease [Clostridiales bacterium]|nr:ABC transporter permease [Clostridiales bacterium]MBD8987339.1 ABC transporter permease [Clostridiales bacterium]MCI5887271.1 ABC transporter permease [Oscillospiraceae bacterium]MDY3924910.1 ABC transporter permease [Eubacteriales bacterium]PWM34527.1 MAG: ABC transporter permease [Oscillospiraceae bacterium]